MIGKSTGKSVIFSGSAFKSSNITLFSRQNAPVLVRSKNEQIAPQPSA
jgi:hypothetical protein